MAGHRQGFPQVRIKFYLINVLAWVGYHWGMTAREIEDEGLLLLGIMVKF